MDAGDLDRIFSRTNARLCFFLAFFSISSRPNSFWSISLSLGVLDTFILILGIELDPLISLLITRSNFSVTPFID